MSEHRVTLRMRPLEWRFLALYQARGMEVPLAHSGHSTFALVPYRWRNLHRLYANSNGYFWLPCPLCNEPFGGHEIGDTIPDPTRGPLAGIAICPACTRRRNNPGEE